MQQPPHPARPKVPGVMETLNLALVHVLVNVCGMNVWETKNLKTWKD